MKKTVKTTMTAILAISAILTASACGAQTVQDTVPADTTAAAEQSVVLTTEPAAEETTPEITTTATEAVTEEQAEEAAPNSRLEELKVELNTVKNLDEATDIVYDWHRQAINAVGNGDLESFEKLYDSGFDASVISDDYGFFRDYFFGSEVYSVDCTAIAFDDDEIAFDALYYYNYINENGADSNKSSSFTRLVLKLENSNWKWSPTKSDEVNEMINQARTAVYGTAAYPNGFCSTDYQMITGKALLSGVNVNVKSAVLNSDGSMTLVLGIENGYNVAKYLTELTGTIDFGKDKDSLFTVIDLSKPYSCSDNLSNLYLPAKSVTFVTVTVAPQDFVNPVSDMSQIIGRCSSNLNHKCGDNMNTQSAVLPTVTTPASQETLFDTAADANDAAYTPSKATAAIMDGKVTVSVVSVDKSKETVTIRVKNGKDKEISTFGLPKILLNGSEYELNSFAGNNIRTSMVKIASGDSVDIVYSVDAPYITDATVIKGELFIMDPKVSDRTYKLALSR